MFCLKEHIYDPTNGCGFLATFIKNERHRNPCIQTREYKQPAKRKAICELSFEDDFDIEQQINLIKLKTCYNEEDKEAIRNAMQKTFKHRKDWIQKESPTLDAILAKYPKFILLPHLVSFNFLSCLF